MSIGVLNFVLKAIKIYMEEQFLVKQIKLCIQNLGNCDYLKNFLHHVLYIYYTYKIQIVIQNGKFVPNWKNCNEIRIPWTMNDIQLKLIEIYNDFS